MKKTVTLLLIVLLALGMVCIPACTDGSGSESDSESYTDAPESTSSETTEETTEEATETEQVEYLTLKIGSYNIANGRNVSHDMKKLADDILAKELDIVGLQEVDRLASRSKYIDTLKVLSEYTGYKYYYFTKAINIAGDEATYGQKGEYGTGILSKYPITAFESFALESKNHEQRMLGYAEIDVDGTKINFFNTHLSYEETSVRSDQFLTIAGKIKDKENCILTGDFNISSLSEYNILSALKTTCNYQNQLVTFPSSGTTIDNILFSKEIVLVSSGVLANGNSDHNMLYAELKIPKTK